MGVSEFDAHSLAFMKLSLRQMPPKDRRRAEGERASVAVYLEKEQYELSVLYLRAEEVRA